MMDELPVLVTRSVDYDAGPGTGLRVGKVRGECDKVTVEVYSPVDGAMRMTVRNPAEAEEMARMLHLLALWMRDEQTMKALGKEPGK